MAFAGLGGSSTGYPQSALRFGLTGIKPIEVVETVKKFGIKFRRVTRTFEQLNPSKSFSDLVVFENEAIFNSIALPKWVDADKLIRIFSDRSISNYEKDTELKQAIEEVRKAERKGRPLLSFTQFMKRRFESHRSDYLEVEAETFLNSNFPLSFYNKLVVSDNTYYDFIKIIESIVRMDEFRASVARNFQMYEKIIDGMKKRISPLIDTVDKCSFHNARLKKFVTVWNSKDYDEILKPRFLDINKLDFSEFETVYNDFGRQLKETRAVLLNYNPEIFKKELDSKEPTNEMFAKLVMLPSDSFNSQR